MKIPPKETAWSEHPGPPRLQVDFSPQAFVRQWSGRQNVIDAPAFVGIQRTRRLVIPEGELLPFRIEPHEDIAESLTTVDAYASRAASAMHTCLRCFSGLWTSMALGATFMSPHQMAGNDGERCFSKYAQPLNHSSL